VDPSTTSFFGIWLVSGTGATGASTTMPTLAQVYDDIKEKTQIQTQLSWIGLLLSELHREGHTLTLFEK